MERRRNGERQQEEMFMGEYFGKDTWKLGFGMMRLPRDPETHEIDVETTKLMVDKFITAGGTYFDTAYVYPGSEVATRKALIERYDRRRYTIASKLNVRVAATAEEAKAQIYTTLERLGLSYVDYYLIHDIEKDVYPKFDEFGIWDYMKKLKAKGLVRHYGFSFHDTPELLDEILTKHPDLEFVQLQLNYADWENPRVTSRRNYEVARKHQKSIVVMEPVKGGLLANPPEEAAELLREANPSVSYPSWAIRYVASKDGIITVLSGMSNIAQMDDNLSYMRHFKPLSQQEEAVIGKVQEVFAKIKSIPCTGCSYCVDGCPMQIPIPDIFRAMNEKLIYRNEKAAQSRYDRETGAKGCSRASACIQCGQCEAACPQHLKVIDRLKECAAEFE